MRLSEKQLETLKETAIKEKRTLAAVIRNFIDEIKETEVRKTDSENGL